VIQNSNVGYRFESSKSNSLAKIAGYEIQKDNPYGGCLIVNQNHQKNFGISKNQKALRIFYQEKVTSKQHAIISTSKTRQKVKQIAIGLKVPIQGFS
jgi:isopropylmalate/homocitrate/citramalate synthase